MKRKIMAKVGHQDGWDSRVKLEGPKKHHDNHGMNASNPGESKKDNKNPAGSGHWEKHYSVNEPSKNMKDTEGSDFNPKRGRDRKTTHLKVNECDH